MELEYARFFGNLFRFGAAMFGKFGCRQWRPAPAKTSSSCVKPSFGDYNEYMLSGLVY